MFGSFIYLSALISHQRFFHNEGTVVRAREIQYFSQDNLELSRPFISLNKEQIINRCKFGETKGKRSG